MVMARGLFEGWHAPLLVLVLALLFGAKRLPDVARGLGRSLRIFKAETEGLRADGTGGALMPLDPNHVPPVTDPVQAPAAGTVRKSE
jgi:sec-independent protein translocase protein TatA